MAIKVNLPDIDQGADYIFEVVVTDDGSPRDLSGWDARMQFRTAIRASTAVIEATIANGKLSFNSPATDGKINVAIPNTETAALTPTRLFYDIELINPSGLVERLMEGRTDVKPEVTR